MYKECLAYFAFIYNFLPHLRQNDMLKNEIRSYSCKKTRTKAVHKNIKQDFFKIQEMFRFQTKNNLKKTF